MFLNLSTLVALVSRTVRHNQGKLCCKSGGLFHIWDYDIFFHGSSPCNYRLLNNHRGVYPAVTLPNVSALLNPTSCKIPPSAFASAYLIGSAMRTDLREKE
jgi:hypothetical protein